MRNKIREHLKRHFSLYILVTNILCAISVAAFAILGVLSTYMSVPVLVVNSAVFGMIYAIGKFGNEQLEDMPKVDEFEKGCPHA
ncbi:hypothetical protein uav_088 [Pseudomonas phage UAVern]|uniref:Uncharacterized protein n=1 Tax=Pseudomonas phage UAVern TaxID=2856997 RepID=A0A975UUE2_9CAUD|nr:hypothetical protein uav_088 [Pseudomonas phage UAVern]